MELPKSYHPADFEPDVTKRWNHARAFHNDGPHGSGTPSYSVVMPPPNVTAPLHAGHALNNTLQDLLVRYHRMRGDDTVWIPGTDHAGIATQTVVEKRLLSQGVKRLEMGRDAFVATTQSWKDDYEAVILEQLKEMGLSCDWDRTRFTMDEMCGVAVRHAFFVLFRDNLIYRGKRLVNWDPVTRTALADDEVEAETVDAHMWYLMYPLTDGSGHVTVATTRPETMFGDTAVAVNPADPAAAALKGKTVTLPIVGRVIPIVEDDHVVMADPDGDVKARFASGFLKVTPAHDQNDWEIGLRHGLDVINILGPDASISDQYGWDDVSDAASTFVRMSREDARTAVVDWFEKKNLLAEVRDYQHSVGHSYRSHAAIEPWLSDQWYVRVTDDRLAGSALRAVRGDTAGDGATTAPPRPGDGDLHIYPARYSKTYETWHENIRDWCISRQLWWGHQIPVWSRTLPLDSVSDEVRHAIGDSAVDDDVTVGGRWPAAGAVHHARLVTLEEVEENVAVPPQATLGRLTRDDDSMNEQELIDALEADGFVRDPDVLDTWFSSGLWPMSTMGWPFPEDFPETEGLLETFNPTSLLSTAREIITLWVSRMVMFNRYFLDGQLPFTDVFIHAMVLDGEGQKMSKSLANGFDPRDVINSHGTDAMRFSLVQMTTDTQDVRIPVDMICPHSGETFSPVMITTPAGHRVAAPIQESPAGDGRKMVSAYGAASGLAEPGPDQPLARNTSSKFDIGRNLANKVWNAARFALGYIDTEGDIDIDTDRVVELGDVAAVDRWIISRLAETTAALEQAIESYQFNVYADTLYHFIWTDFCDRYLEAIKPTIRENREQRVVLAAVLDAMLRLMHPTMPFVTEALWPSVRAARVGQISTLDIPDSELLAHAGWPRSSAANVDSELTETVRRADQLIAEIRRIRSSRNVKPKRLVTLHVDDDTNALIDVLGIYVQTLARVERVESTSDPLPAVSSAMAFEGRTIAVSGFEGEPDLDVERKRLDKAVQQLTNNANGLRKRLENPGYLANASPDVVQQSRDQLVVLEADLETATEARRRLDAATS